MYPDIDNLIDDITGKGDGGFTAMLRELLGYVDQMDDRRMKICTAFARGMVRNTDGASSAAQAKRR